MDKRILVFTSQNDAAAAVQKISANMGLTGSTFLYALPQPLADDRWYLPYPSDDAWLAGVTKYTIAAGTGLIAIGEGAVHIPVSVTNFQARAVLMQMPSPTGVADRTIFDDVNDALKAQGGVPYQAWEQSNDFTRNGALVNSMAEKLGLTSDQLDQIFIAAAIIEA